MNNNGIRDWDINIKHSLAKFKTTRSKVLDVEINLLEAASHTEDAIKKQDLSLGSRIALERVACLFTRNLTVKDALMKNLLGKSKTVIISNVRQMTTKKHYALSNLINAFRPYAVLVCE